MTKIKFFLSLLLIISLFTTQVGVVFAAVAGQDTTAVSGTVERITLETDSRTGLVTVIVELSLPKGKVETFRLSQENGIDLGLASLDADGKATINEPALGTTVEIEQALILPAQDKDRHPVAGALATFFADVASYEAIMAAHSEGAGFGVIAQALWLTNEVGGDAQLFKDLLEAKISNDYGAFSEFTEDGSVPENWGQLRKALLSKGSVGSVTSSDGNPGNGQPATPDKDKDKNKGNENNGNQIGKDKDKDKDKDKNK